MLHSPVKFDLPAANTSTVPDTKVACVLCVCVLCVCVWIQSAQLCKRDLVTWS